MSTDSDTPPRQHRAVSSGEHDLVSYRLDEMSQDIRDLTKEFRAFIARQQEQESDHIRAVERCSQHGDDIRKLADRVDDTKRDPVALWTAIGAGAAAAYAAVSQIWGSK